MMLRDTYIIDKCKDIEDLLLDAANWSSKNEKLGAHLAAYISVLIIGMLEDCIEHLVEQRTGKTGDPEIQHYVTLVLGQRFKNPDHSSISGLLKEFSDEYQSAFKEKISYNGKEATDLKSILDNKNSLAHLGTRKLQMSIKDIDDYYRSIITLLETLEQILA